MDNQTRIPQSEYHHRHYTWLDAMLQQSLNCQILIMMGTEIGRTEFNDELQQELNYLQQYVHDFMWDDSTQFYYDRRSDGQLSHVKSIGAFWGLLSNIISLERAKKLMAHLENPQTFKRPHPIPTQAYNDQDYTPTGGYWLGGVWSPTNYMTLLGLTEHHQHDLAHSIAFAHLQAVAHVFIETGTLWENYAPESFQAGRPAAKDFVGWTGISAINILIEYVIGIQKIPQGLRWHIHLIERHGVLRYPLGNTHEVDLICEQRADANIPPLLRIKTPYPLVLEVLWGTITQRFDLLSGEHLYQLAL